MTKLFQGTYTALITPFALDGTIDWTAFDNLIEKQIEGGVEGILFVGTTGESPTLSYEEHYEILRRSTEVVNGRCKVIHGTGSNCTTTSIKIAKVSAETGADAQLLINPYYNKPTQKGMLRHFISIAEATDLPVIIYNIKSRTGVNLETSTLVELAQHKNIVGVKEASGDISQMMDVIRLTPDDFSVLVGDDSLTLPFMAAGGDGLISVISNCAPRSVSDYIRTCLNGDFESARKSFYQLLDLMKISFIETNPIPIKEIMAQLGYCTSVLRPPLYNIEESSMQAIAKAVEFVKREEFKVKN